MIWQDKAIRTRMSETAHNHTPPEAGAPTPLFLLEVGGDRNTRRWLSVDRETDLLYTYRLV